jgi:hypothetical protein
MTPPRPPGQSGVRVTVEEREPAHDPTIITAARGTTLGCSCGAFAAQAEGGTLEQQQAAVVELHAWHLIRIPEQQ